MIVTAALCWWNELPEDLEACVRGVGEVADRLVAVDGAYRRYPGATIRSSKAEVEAIVKAARAVGLEVDIHQPGELWVGQVAKRTFAIQEAIKGSDWVIPLDADHVIRTDRLMARAGLKAMPSDTNSVGVEFYTPRNDDVDFEKTIATYWHAGLAGETIKMAQIFRALPGTYVKDRHWHYIAERDGKPVEMLYGGKFDRMLGVPYLVEHRSLFRTEEQILAGRAYCNDREIVKRLTGQEDDKPGLPAPVWDFETIPYKPPPRKLTPAQVRDEARKARIELRRNGAKAR
jgi:hypothetical protein